MWSVSSEEDEPIFLQQDYNYPGENGKKETEGLVVRT